MTTKVRTRPVPTFPDLEPLTELLRNRPMTVEDHLKHIRALTQRINGYVHYMSSVDNMCGTSSEAKDKAVHSFYEILHSLERELMRVHHKSQQRRKASAKRVLEKAGRH